MAIIVELPRLSDTMEEGVIAKWHITVGDKVKRGQIIADVETDKATMEFESFDAGTVLKLIAPEGETMPIGTPIAVLGKPDEDAEAALANRGAGGKAAEPAKPAAAPVAEPAAPPPVQQAAAPAPAKVETASAPVDTPPPEDGRIAASPLARKLAREAGLRLVDIPGSGPHGRIVKTDVVAAASNGLARTPVEAPAPSATPVVAPGEQRPFLTRPDAPQKLSQMRKAIARRMAQANTEIPHFYLTTAIDMSAGVKLRESLKQALPDVKISFNDLVLLGVARALTVHPEVNAYWDGQTIVRRGDIHLGVAVAIDEGLIVPAIRFADQKSLKQIAIEARDLGTRAREKKLTPQEMSGSTFTVSNLGMFGITEFAAVVNPGEGAILAVGAITEELVPAGGQPKVVQRMKVTLSCDHRVMDGAIGAQFLATLRRDLEQPLALLA